MYQQIFCSTNLLYTGFFYLIATNYGETSVHQISLSGKWRPRGTPSGSLNFMFLSHQMVALPEVFLLKHKGDEFTGRLRRLASGNALEFKSSASPRVPLQLDHWKQFRRPKLFVDYCIFWFYQVATSNCVWKLNRVSLLYTWIRDLQQRLNCKLDWEIEKHIEESNGKPLLYYC